MGGISLDRGWYLSFFLRYLNYCLWIFKLKNIATNGTTIVSINFCLKGIIGVIDRNFSWLVLGDI